MLTRVVEAAARGVGEVLDDGEGGGARRELRFRVGAEVLGEVAPQRVADGLVVQDATGDDRARHRAVRLRAQEQTDAFDAAEVVDTDRDGLDVDHGDLTASRVETLGREPTVTGLDGPSAHARLPRSMGRERRSAGSREQACVRPRTHERPGRPYGPTGASRVDARLWSTHPPPGSRSRGIPHQVGPPSVASERVPPSILTVPSSAGEERCSSRPSHHPEVGAEALARGSSRCSVRLHGPAASGRAILAAVTAASGS